MKPVIIASEAEHELAESVAFYERKVPGLGLEFELAARNAVRLIQADPERSVLQHHDTRRFILPRFLFVIHYVDLPDNIWILAFAHASRKPGYWHQRL